jgi:flagellar hook-associated protein 1
MSISGALSSSLSGLTAAARAAEVVSSNIANARTEGYGRREVQLSARSVGGTGQGVQVDAVRRMVDLVLLTDRRIAQSGRPSSLPRWNPPSARQRPKARWASGFRPWSNR